MQFDLRYKPRHWRPARRPELSPAAGTLGVGLLMVLVWGFVWWVVWAAVR